jgi:hypothetical protein
VILAVLLLALAAVAADAARVHEAPNAREVSLLEARDLRADAPDAPDDLVAGHHRVRRVAPLVPRLMDVGVADAAVFDFDEHVPRPRLAPLERERRERRSLFARGIPFCLKH